MFDFTLARKVCATAVSSDRQISNQGMYDRGQPILRKTDP